VWPFPEKTFSSGKNWLGAERKLIVPAPEKNVCSMGGKREECLLLFRRRGGRGAGFWGRKNLKGGKSASPPCEKKKAGIFYKEEPVAVNRKERNCHKNIERRVYSQRKDRLPLSPGRKGKRALPSKS